METGKNTVGGVKSRALTFRGALFCAVLLSVLSVFDSFRSRFAQSIEKKFAGSHLTAVGEAMMMEQSEDALRKNNDGDVKQVQVRHLSLRPPGLNANLTR